MSDTEFFSGLLLPLSLALIMLGLGLSLTRADFINLVKYPKTLAVGLAAQMIGLPVLAFTFAFLAPGLTPELKVGIVLLASCPGGATSNLLNYWLRGNLALSVSLTVVNSFLTQFTIPILVNIALVVFIGHEQDISLPVLQTFFNILLITVLPTVTGIIIRARYPVFSEKVRKPLKYVMTSFMAIALVGAIFIEKNDEVDIPVNEYWVVLVITLLMNFTGMLLGFYTARYFKLGLKSQTTIAIEVGLHNTLLAITVATAIIHNATFAIPAAVYALFSFFTTAGFGWYMNRKNFKWR